MEFDLDSFLAGVLTGLKLGRVPRERVLPPESGDYMITESGDRMITESGDYMITE